jgi:hypothetical protein
VPKWPNNSHNRRLSVLVGTFSMDAAYVAIR